MSQSIEIHGVSDVFYQLRTHIVLEIVEVCAAFMNLVKAHEAFAFISQSGSGSFFRVDANTEHFIRGIIRECIKCYLRVLFESIPVHDYDCSAFFGG